MARILQRAVARHLMPARAVTPWLYATTGPLVHRPSGESDRPSVPDDRTSVRHDSCGFVPAVAKKEGLKHTRVMVP